MGAIQKLGAWSLRAGLDAYANGHYAKAMRSWLFASRLGVQDADLYIGELYERGEGVLPSPVDAAASVVERLTRSSLRARTRGSARIAWAAGSRSPPRGPP